MSESLYMDLAECTEFRQVIDARPPRLVHAATFLLVALIGSVVTWAALTRADLVVRAPGRIRPITSPKKVFNPSRGEVLSASAAGRVRAVHIHEGDQVRQG